MCYNVGIHSERRVVFINNLKFGGQKESQNMAGTREGGLKAAATNKAKYGKNFYARIGAEGGRKGHTGGFAADKELARRAGAIGGRISKRGPAKKKTA